VLEQVKTDEKRLEDYLPIIGEASVEEIRALAAPLKGARVLHVNATAFGGGVAEILGALVPLMRNVGLEAEWQVIHGEDEFFNVTKSFHNAMQGAEVPLTDEAKEIFNRYDRQNADALEGDYDFIVMHDPQTAAMLHFHGRTGGKHWIWRCHIDTSTPYPPVWNFLQPYLELYDAGVFTMEQYVYGDLHFPTLAIIHPTIDPLSPKNRPQTPEQSREIISHFGIDTQRPMLVQVSRFDPWKDPLGVIDAYRMVKEQIPDLQLALVGSMASDDPEGWDYYERTIRHAGEDYDIHILHNLHGVGNVEVNAFQSAADVVIQKSTREGFGLVVTEALWKGKPVIGGNVGGIPLQVIDGETGYLVDSPETCAERALHLLRHPEEVRSMGHRAREHVRHNFLITHHLKDYLELFRRLSGR